MPKFLPGDLVRLPSSQVISTQGKLFRVVAKSIIEHPTIWILEPLDGKTLFAAFEEDIYLDKFAMATNKILRSQNEKN